MVLLRVVVMRHGHRLSSGHDPQLTDLGREQARQIAASPREFGLESVDAIFASPFVRAIQTAAPLAAALRRPIRIDRGFGEIMPEPHGNPLGQLHYDLQHRDLLPGVAAGVVAEDSGSPVPVFPDIAGPDYYRQGDAEQRRRTVTRHREALERAFAEADEEGWSTVLVVGHGCSSDFIAEALLGDRFPSTLHTGKRPTDGENQPPPPHVSLTTLVRGGGGGGEWVLDSFAKPTVSTETANAGETAGTEQGGGGGGAGSSSSL